MLTALIQLPFVQNEITSRLKSKLEAATGYRVNFDKVGVLWYDEISLNGIQVFDRNDSLMVDVNRLILNFDITGINKKGRIHLNKVSLDQPTVHLIKHPGEDTLNLTGFIVSLKNMARKQTKTKKRTWVTFTDVFIDRGFFTYNYIEKDSLPSNEFDLFHFKLNEINAHLEGFEIFNDSLSFYSDFLNSNDPVYNRLHINDMQTQFLYCDDHMSFDDLNLNIGESFIQDSLVFNYKSPSALSYFIDSVDIEAKINKSIIDSKDLSLFASYFRGQNEKHEVSGVFSGGITDFSVYNLNINYAQRSEIKGNMQFSGLPNVGETFMFITVDEANMFNSDLQKIIPGKRDTLLTPLGKTQIEGQFIGFVNDFVSNATFQTEIGYIETDINLKLFENNAANYKGDLVLKNFDLGKYFNRPEDFQKVSLSGEIQGSGLILENADFILDAKVTSLGIKGYNYKNIVTNARLASELFEGKLSIDDPNLQFVTEGTIDLNKNKELIQITASLDTAFFHELNLSKEKLSLSGDFHIDATGLEIDSLRGNAQFSNTDIEFKNNRMHIDTLSLISVKDSLGRKIKLESDLIDFNAEGKFNLTTAWNDLQLLLKEYTYILSNEKEKLSTLTRKSSDESYDIDFEVTGFNMKPILDLVESKMQIQDTIYLSGNFQNGATSILNAYLETDTLQLNKLIMKDLKVDLSTSKFKDSTNVLAYAIVESSKQKVTNNLTTEDLFFEAIWSENHIDLEFFAKQENENNDAKIIGELDFLTDSTRLRIEEAKFNILDKSWGIDPDNSIAWINKIFKVSNFNVFHNEEIISLNGVISDSTEHELDINVNNFKISTLNPLMKVKYYGTLNSDITLSNLFKSPEIDGTLSIDSLKIDDFLVGNVNGVSEFNKQSQKIALDLNVVREGFETISLKGDVFPKSDRNQLDLVASFDDANLTIFEPYLKTIFSDIRGTAQGDFKITGMFDYPILRGNGFIDDGGIRMNYMNTYYTFRGSIFFDENQIGFRNLQLRDVNDQQGVLNGGIFHDGFQYFTLDLRGELQNFKVLNTTIRQNELFYGEAYATGDVEILGSFENLYITANATSEKGTHIHIPVSEEVENTTTTDFITIEDADSEQTLELNATEEEIDLSGVILDFNFDVTTDAYLEIIFDDKTGDILRGYGNGKIKMIIDTQGEFNMFGDYQIERGDYNFIFYNVINKHFSILPDSRITWYGDPYQGILDIRASYSNLASLRPILNIPQDDQVSTSNTDVARKYPVNALMDIDGPLLSPNVDFDIEIVDYPRQMLAEVQAFHRDVQNNEQYLNQQVFSLLVLGGLTPRNTFTVENTIATNSMGELLSNQISYWLSQVDDNLDINLDFQQFETFRVRLSYSMLDGRLTITRDGTFNNNANNAGLDNNTQPVNELIGDWTIEYVLTKNGKLKVKMYNKTDYNNIYSLTGSDVNAGLSLLYTENFDNIRDLFGKDKKKKEEEESPEDENEQNNLNDDAVLREENDPE
ncbi:translocation/assembly module TamB domain-containing protein [Marinigracilibium pacificum]|uniref:Translocation and assembly module TamB C-terminal domain-containing protein n=1 Tax=Marinigracilibium pacificum TaxID=2729599 RepID=A0A848J4X5_9BACT|nr:translocation/assembly module TamB domain-containing protein [Marinigracilibium pacificum]NMM50535.1 hypothetical protein [Marinigracilibium pacificum]